jgi:hypothetical protein
MDIYFLICVQEQNQSYMAVHRILKSIPTTLEDLCQPHSKPYKELMEMQAFRPTIYPLIVSRNADISFIEREGKHNSDAPAAAAYH